MEDKICEVCHEDPCICVDGFSIETADDDLIEDEVVDESLQEDPLLAATLRNDFDDLDENEELYDEEEDDGIDLPFTDED